MGITIRNAALNDLDTVTEIEAVCFPAAEAATRESFEDRLKTFADSFFIAEENGKAIGFINGAVTDSVTITDEMFEDSSLHNPNGAYQSIFGLDVIPEKRKNGIAAELMNHIIEDARKKGQKRAYSYLQGQTDTLLREIRIQKFRCIKVGSRRCRMVRYAS